MIFILSFLLGQAAVADCPILQGLYTTGSTTLIISQDGCREIGLNQDGFSTLGQVDGLKHKGHRFEWTADGGLDVTDYYLFGNVADHQAYRLSTTGELNLTVTDGKGRILHEMSYRKVSNP